MASPSKPRTVRFAQVIKQSGKPHVHTLWMAPDQDTELRQAEKTQRVMTLTEPAHGRAWVGEVGLNLDRKTAHQYLIFPKTLRAFAEAKIVGINLDELEEARLVSAKPPHTPAPRHKSKPKPPPIPPAKPKPAPPPPPPPAPTPVVKFVAPPTMSAAKTASPPRPAKAKRELAPERAPTVDELTRAIRAAMRDLQKGNSVAAFQKLEKAVAAGKER